jgi:hypothetical protein
MTRSTLNIIESKSGKCVCVCPGVSDLDFMHSHGALQTLSELSDTLFLLVDLIISRYLIGESMTETYSSLETISTFDHGTEIPGNTIPQLSPFEIFLAI